jgi:hypothetical protein
MQPQSVLKLLAVGQSRDPNLAPQATVPIARYASIPVTPASGGSCFACGTGTTRYSGSWGGFICSPRCLDEIEWDAVTRVQASEAYAGEWEY